MIVEALEVGVFAENCYVIGCEFTREAVIIDPGDEPERIFDKVQRLALETKYILLTHGHLDHVKELNALNSRLNVPVMMNSRDQFLLDNLPIQAASFGLTTAGIPTIDRYISEGDRIDFGKISLDVVETPGHSPGSVSFLTQEAAFVGDVLFSMSIGRTDLPGGDFETLINTIRTKLLILDDHTKVYPGHGATTTVGEERRSNPFLRNDAQTGLIDNE